MKQADVDVSAEELRIKVRALAVPFSGMLEEAADEHLATALDPDQRRRALVFKINGIPVMQNALFDPDPLAALLDAWVLVAQLRVFVETGRGFQYPEQEKTPILKAVDRMERQIEDLAVSISATGDISTIRGRVYEVARNTPPEVTFTTRPSMQSQLAAFTAEAKPGLGKAIGQLSHSIGDVLARLDVYTAFIPKQARWQAELMIADMMAGRDVGGTLNDFSSMTDSFDRIAATIEKAPHIIESERKHVLKILQEERIIALDAIREQLVLAFDRLAMERDKTIYEGLRAERIAMMETLTQERIAILDTIREERMATLEELDQIVGGLAEDAMRRVVDHAFVRVLQLLALLVLVALVGVFLFAKVIRKPERGR
jgi:hypothetical protein